MEIQTNITRHNCQHYSNNSGHGQIQWLWRGLVLGVLESREDKEVVLCRVIVINTQIQTQIENAQVSNSGMILKVQEDTSASKLSKVL